MECPCDGGRMKTLWLMELGRCEGLERIDTREYLPEEKLAHYRRLSLADSAYAHLSAAIGSDVAKRILSRATVDA